MRTLVRIPVDLKLARGLADEADDLDAARLPGAGAARDGLALEVLDARAVGDERVREDDVGGVRQVQAGEAVLQAEKQHAAGPERRERGGAGVAVAGEQRHGEPVRLQPVAQGRYRPPARRAAGSSGGTPSRWSAM